jgi:hypothetical protein
MDRLAAADLLLLREEQSRVLSVVAEVDASHHTGEA